VARLRPVSPGGDASVPTISGELVPLLDDRREAVRVRAAAVLHQTAVRVVGCAHVLSGGSSAGF